MLRLKKRKSPSDVRTFLRDVVQAERKTDRRGDDRIDISIVVAIVPLDDQGRPLIERAFATCTRNISAEGISLVSNKRMDDQRLLVGFAGKTVSFVLAEVLHRQKLPLGCEQLGLRMIEMVQAADYPGLERFSL